MAEKVDTVTGEVTEDLVVVREVPREGGGVLVPTTPTPSELLTPPGFAPGTAPITRGEASLLQRPLTDDEVDILPTGEVYLTQVKYRQRLNEAFGPGQWSLVPHGTPRIQDNTIVQFWSLYIRGHKVADSIGEAEYQPDNDRMSWATAWESQKSNALMRLCKDLGIASECWDRRWTEAWKARCAVAVWRKSGARRPQWRRVDAPPWYDETGPVEGGPLSERQEDDRPVEGARARPDTKPDTKPPTTNGGVKRRADRKVTEGQVRRLFAILSSRARTLGVDKGDIQRELRLRLADTLQIESTEEITERDYDDVVSWVEKWSPREEPL